MYDIIFTNSTENKDELNIKLILHATVSIGSSWALFSVIWSVSVAGMEGKFS